MKSLKVLSRFLRTVILVGASIYFQSCARHYVDVIPTAPEGERAMKPYANAVWVDGSWEWKKDHHEWRGGYYNPPHRNSAYQPGEWRHNAKGYYYVHGRWTRHKMNEEAKGADH